MAKAPSEAVESAVMLAAPAVTAETGAPPRPATVTTRAGSRPPVSNWWGEAKPCSSPFVPST
jgi:hypothetical protein